MKAVGLYKSLPIDHPEALLDVDVPKPTPGERDLLVAVKAIAVNPVDYKVRSRLSTNTTLRILGWDAAGIVDAVGPGVTLFKPGDAVYYAGDITRPGCNAEHHVVDERIAGRKPLSLDFPQAAALPLTTITAYEALFDRLGIDVEGRQHGRTVLIIGGAGGVGSIGIQLAKLAGLTVIVTASRPESQTWVKQLGADATIDHRLSLCSQLDALGYQYVDYVAVFNNTDQHWNQVCDVVAPQGRITSIVENEGALAQGVLKQKSAMFAWEFMFTRSMYKTDDMIQQQRLLNRVAEWIDAGHIRTTVKDVLSPINASHLRHAHAVLERGQAIGKIVLQGF
ncbi:MAG: zinc-binding alcohol dehydrogenase family protein [Nitrospiraceae bacterium]